MTRLPPLALASLALALSAQPLAAQQFARDAAALTDPAIWTNGVALGDFDLDGDLDIAFANGFDYGPGGALPQRLFRNDGAGNFTDVSTQLNVADFNAQMVIAEDCENDGDLDLIYSPAGAFPATTERARILINDGTGVFSDESATRMPLTTMSSWSVVAADIDNDGDRDLALNSGCLNFTGMPAQARIFLNDGTGHYTDVTATHAPVELYNSQDIIAFDYDGDFDLDLAHSGFGSAAKRSSLWVNDGTGHFTVSPTLDGLCTVNTYEADWSDLDGDGDWDASVMSISSANEGWGENRGLGIAPPETVFSGVNGNDDNELASMDYDVDGDLDVFVGTLTGNREKVYQQGATGVFTRVDIFTQITDSTLDLAFGDLDGDGRYDVVTAQGESGVMTNKIYDNTGPVDVLPPRLLRVESPPAVLAGGLVFRAMLQDCWVDDGLTSADASVSWETYESGVLASSGGGPAAFIGGGMQRVVVPTTASTGGVRVTWLATDHAGNAAAPVTVAVGDIGGDVWEDLGLGLAGTGGVPPVLAGSGPLVGGSTNHLVLSGGQPGGSTHLIAGLSRIDLPFKGGVMVPAITTTVWGLPLDGLGSLDLGFVWPASLPAGIDFYLQHWLPDAGGPAGFAASNGLRGTSH
ncbi:MAG TPA: VCBS repeat-containing protein [Planctomycetota bacterium]|nr:VCBS repeat-containing protein [Planctomycetota bacterium]